MMEVYVHISCEETGYASTEACTSWDEAYGVADLANLVGFETSITCPELDSFIEATF